MGFWSALWNLRDILLMRVSWISKVSVWISGLGRKKGKKKEKKTLHRDAKHGKCLGRFFQMQEWIETKHVLPGWRIFSTPFMKKLALRLLWLAHVGWHHEKWDKVGSESLWERRMKTGWVEFVLYFYLTAHMELSFGLLLLTSSKWVDWRKEQGLGIFNAPCLSTLHIA